VLCMRIYLGSAVCPEDGRGCFACAPVRDAPAACPEDGGVGACRNVLVLVGGAAGPPLYTSAQGGYGYANTRATIRLRMHEY